MSLLESIPSEHFETGLKMLAIEQIQTSLEMLGRAK